MPVLGVDLDSLQFSTPDGGAGGALPLRRDAITTVLVPEWSWPASTHAEDSPVLYVAPDWIANDPKLRLRGRVTAGDRLLCAVPPSMRPDDVFADDGSLRPGVDSALAASSALLGVVPPTLLNQLDFAIGVIVQTRGSLLGTLGVGRGDIEWQWYVRQGGDPWQPLLRSQHRVFTVLAPPTSPWQVSDQTKRNLPWVAALDLACAWAGGERDPIAAASAVVRKLRTHGDRLGYDPQSALYTVTDRSFDVSAFLERLRRGPGAGPHMACYGFAMAVETMANILGCAVRRMSWSSGFEANPVRRLGSRNFEPWSDGTLSVHQFTRRSRDGDELVFDAAFSVDTDANPTGQDPNHIETEVTAMPAGEYRRAMLTYLTTRNPGHRRPVEEPIDVALPLVLPDVIIVDPQQQSLVAVARTIGVDILASLSGPMHGYRLRRLQLAEVEEAQLVQLVYGRDEANPDVQGHESTITQNILVSNDAATRLADWKRYYERLGATVGPLNDSGIMRVVSGDTSDPSAYWFGSGTRVVLLHGAHEDDALLRQATLQLLQLFG